MPGTVHTGRPTTVKSGPVVISRTPQPTTSSGRRPRGQKVTPPPGYLYFQCSSPKAGFQVRMGDDPWIPTDGWGAYEVVDRSRQVGMTIEGGVPPWQYTGSILFDGLKHKMAQDDDIESLLTLAHGDQDNGPGIITIYGLAELEKNDWVIESLDFDAASQIRTNGKLRRLRQKVTLTIREYVSPDYLRTASNAFKRPKGDTTVVITKHGDTPHKLAVRYHCDWKDIRDLNPTRKIHKANQVLATGIRVHVPKKKTSSAKDKTSKTRGKRG
jgi:hypothetical protein